MLLGSVISFLAMHTPPTTGWKREGSVGIKFSLGPFAAAAID